MTTLPDFGGCFGTAFGHFSFGLSQPHGHGSWLVCEDSEVALIRVLQISNNKGLSLQRPFLKGTETKL